MSNRLRRFLGFVLTVCFLLAGLARPPIAKAEGDGQRVNRALLVGVDDFVSRTSTYPAATNNVFAMQEVLQASKIPFDAIMIPDAPVTTPQALAELIRETFADADGDDANYLYISTHGVCDAGCAGGAALLLSDGQTESCLTPQALEDAFKGIAGVKIILLDACYSGAFIGKGMRRQPDKLCFLGDDFKVLVSSGAMEESWYWNTAASTETSAAEGFQQGAYYFTQALCQSLSPRYGILADANKDGNVTLRELYNQVLENHAASTPQVYPQNDDYVVFSYDLKDMVMDSAQRSPIGDVVFSDTTQSAGDQQLTVEFIALRPVRVAYQIVNQRDGQWRFDEAQLLYDDVEQYTAYGDAQGAISPGRKLRKLTLNLNNGDDSGYVMVQLVSIENGKLTVHAGRVIAISPAQGDMKLDVETASRYETSNPRELAIFVRHAFPCQLSVNIVNAKGETVCRLSRRQSTRPLRIDPAGSTFYWNGCAKNGDAVEPGTYRISVTGYMGEKTETAKSNPIRVTSLRE